MILVGDYQLSSSRKIDFCCFIGMQEQIENLQNNFKPPGEILLFLHQLQAKHLLMQMNTHVLQNNKGMLQIQVKN